MVCLTHLELCPFCNHVALKVCEFDEPYPRVEAECMCCGYKIFDKPQDIREINFKKVLDKLGRKQIGEICVDDKCGSKNVITLINEGDYKEFRCLDCGSEWNSKEMKHSIKNVKNAMKCKENEEPICYVVGEGTCPLCGYDIGHKREGYLVEIECTVCGFHNLYEERKPDIDPASIECKDFERVESV